MQEQTSTVTRERRYIYNGDNRPSATGFAVRPNKRGTRRRISTFNIILLLFCFGIGIVFYVNNIITVNQLAFDIGQLQAKYAALSNTNATLRAEVNRKAALERIGVIASEQMNLRYPPEQPVYFEIDRDKLATLKDR
jgi:cell division protein FtsL